MEAPTDDSSARLSNPFAALAGILDKVPVEQQADNQPKEKDSYREKETQEERTEKQPKYSSLEGGVENIPTLVLQPQNQHKATTPPAKKQSEPSLANMDLEMQKNT